MYEISNRRAYALEQALKAYIEAARYNRNLLSEIEAAAVKAIRGCHE
jgi:hypothetical protein